MQQLARSAAPLPLPGFASVLAELAAPKKPPARDVDALDGLEDDIATLSYEQALRFPSQVAEPAGNPAAKVSPAILSRKESSPESKRRRATSITIRLTEAEAGQVHQRAAEAGLTVSAYLRSCAFEVESLRAEVKSTLAQLRRATAEPRAEPAEQPPAAPASWRRRWSLLLRARRRA